MGVLNAGSGGLVSSLVCDGFKGRCTVRWGWIRTTDLQVPNVAR